MNTFNFKLYAYGKPIKVNEYTHLNKLQEGISAK